jgi:hypothetical protein
MPRSIAAAIVLALALITGGSTSASACWWFLCDDEPIYEPPPIYVYDHNSGPTWTGNGWAYLPIGQYRPGPGVYMPPPPPGYLRHMPPHSDPNGLRRLLPF